MRDLFIDWPMPVVWLMLIGLMSMRLRIGRLFLIVSTVLLIISTLPLVGRALLALLSYGAQTNLADLRSHNATAIFVPTAGSFRDADGKWWPEEASIRRFTSALKLARELRLPVIVGGGTPRGNQPPETETLMRLFKPSDVEVIAVPRGRNTIETAVVVAELPQARQLSLILVTDVQHIARMRASLRRQGLTVKASIAAQVLSRPGRIGSVGLLDIVPSLNGFYATRTALPEYVGLLWYLVTDKIRFRDL